MKTVLTKFLAFSGIALLMLASCKKDETKVTATNGKPGALTASASSIVLTSATAGDNAVSFSYTPTDYGFKSAVTYTLQIAVKGANFVNSKDIGLTAKSKVYTGGDLNTMLLSMGLIAGNPTQLETRIKSELATNVQTAYSNVLTLTVTPYFDIPVYPSLSVPGAYEGWSPPTAPRISSPADNKQYEGYVYYAENSATGAYEFKYTSAPDWDHTNYGDGGGGKLSTDGGAGNLKVPAAGYYLLKGDLTSNTWSATETQWGIIGDATPKGWDASTALTFDVATQTWTGTVHLTAAPAGATSPAGCKFRANDGWDINLGDNKPANGVLKYGGENIPVLVTGDYKVTLNLSNPAFYFYSLVKQ